MEDFKEVNKALKVQSFKPALRSFKTVYWSVCCG